jgi:hypothetical protein
VQQHRSPYLGVGGIEKRKKGAFRRSMATETEASSRVCDAEPSRLRRPRRNRAGNTATRRGLAGTRQGTTAAAPLGQHHGQQRHAHVQTILRLTEVGGARVAVNFHANFIQPR